jgi:hypothetical protein
METRVVDSTFREKWDAYVSSCPHSVAWQSHDWSRTVSSCYSAEYLPLAALEGGEIRGILPLYRLTDGPAADTLLSIPFAVAGGIAADGDLAEAALLERAIALLGEMGLSRLVLKQYKKRIAGDLQTDDTYCNRELELRPDTERAWNEISAENKERIARTKAMRVTLDYPSKDVDQFYALLTRHQRDTGIPGPAVGWIRALLDFGMYTMALLRVEGRPEAATLVKCFKDTVSFPYTCLRRQDSDHVDLACKLYWELICQRAQAGTRIFHSGRLPRTGGTNDYRLGWGGTAHGYFYQYHPPRQGATESSQKRGLKRSLLQVAWKRLPIPIARAVGPKIVRRYP